VAGEEVSGPPKRERRRTQSERRGEADQRMVDATIELIAEKGFAGLVLGEVGVRAGYSTTLPIHYYKTKEALILLTAQRIIADYNELLQRERRGVSGLEAIRTYVRTYLQYALEHPQKRRALFMITSEAAVDAPLRESVATLARNAAASLSKRIRDGQATGEIEPMVDPDTYGTLIFAWLRGAISLWAIDPDVDLARLAAGIEGTVLKALLNRDTAPGRSATERKPTSQ
jgi:AcrR family transcriptional regulator